MDIPNDELTEIMSITKKVVTATGAKDYNILQNNGRAAHQQVDHVHFHVIPKPDAEQGLQIGWPQKEVSSEDLKSLLAEMKSRM
jgi:diadenosine tetraphosphate (Ap4A) HIT family hydrolase